MPRYIVERTFPDELRIPISSDGAQLCQGVVERNHEEGVTWIHSYVSADRRKTFCRLRRAKPGGDPQDRSAQRPSGRANHPGPRTRPLFLRVHRRREGVTDQAGQRCRGGTESLGQARRRQ